MLIVPGYNEEERIAAFLLDLACMRGDCEVIVADGASTDGTLAHVEARATDYPRPLRIVTAERHQARQLKGAFRRGPGRRAGFSARRRARSASSGRSCSS
jgi:glycosyltransferase involved in cell wall biosynthesis